MTHRQTHIRGSAPRVRGSRWLGAALVVSGLLLPGCPKEEGAVTDEGVEDLTVVVEADKSRILEEEAKLQERKQAAEDERATLEQQREALRKQMASLSKKDKAQRTKLETEAKRLEDEEKRMRQQLRNFESEREKLEREKNELLEKISTAVGGGSKGGPSTAALKSDIQHINKNIGALNKRMDDYEAASQKRHEELVALLQQVASSGGTTRVVTVSAPSGGPSGGGANRNQVLKMQKEVARVMKSKGLLDGDLPPSARNLEKDGTQALKTKDYDAAAENFSQLESIVTGIKVDQGFVQAKMNRINKVHSAQEGKLDAKQKARLQKLLDDVSDSFSDGRYDRANQKINEIYRLLSKG